MLPGVWAPAGPACELGAVSLQLEMLPASLPPGVGERSVRVKRKKPSPTLFKQSDAESARSHEFWVGLHQSCPGCKSTDRRLTSWTKVYSAWECRERGCRTKWSIVLNQ